MDKSHPLLFKIGENVSIMLGLPTIPSWKNGSRPKKAKRGTFGFNQQTKSFEYWDGKNWFAASLIET